MIFRALFFCSLCCVHYYHSIALKSPECHLTYLSFLHWSHGNRILLGLNFINGCIHQIKGLVVWCYVPQPCLQWATGVDNLIRGTMFFSPEKYTSCPHCLFSNGTKLSMNIMNRVYLIFKELGFESLTAATTPLCSNWCQAQ